MMLTDEDYDDQGHACHICLSGMRREIEISCKSGTEYIAQVAEHIKKKYWDVKSFETQQEAQEFYLPMEFNSGGRKRLIKVDNSVITVLKEEMGKDVAQNHLTPFKKVNKIMAREVV